MALLKSDEMTQKRRGQLIPILIILSLLSLVVVALAALRLGLLPGVVAWASERATRVYATRTLYTPPPAPPTATATPSPTATRNTSTPSATPTATPRPTRTAVATTTVVSQFTPTFTPSARATISTPVTMSAATSTPGVTPSTTPTPTEPTYTPGRPWPTPDPAAARDHYWLERPIGPEGHIYASPWYPYGTDGRGQYLPHHGVDIVNDEGTPVLAVAEAQVEVAGTDAEHAYGPWPNFYGNLIVLRLFRTYRDQPVFVLYGHLSQIDVQPGDIVQPGQPIGRVGMSGIALGPHLHLEVRLGQNDYAHTRNPELWLKPTPGYGTLVGRLINAEGRAWPNVPIFIYQAPNFDRIWQQVYTYLDLPDINPDEEWGENFMLADMPAGTYRLETKINGHLYRKEVEIKDGQSSFVLIQTVD